MIFVFRKGGYDVKECSTAAGCGDDSSLAQILTSNQLTMYGYILNLTTLGSLGDSYTAFCGKLCSILFRENTKQK